MVASITRCNTVSVGLFKFEDSNWDTIGSQVKIWDGDKILFQETFGWGDFPMAFERYKELVQKHQN